MWKLLQHDEEVPCRLAFESLVTVSPGRAEGRLVGGNLALVCSLLGTKYEPDFDGNILLLEDTDEPPYRIDRFLAQLRLNGCFERVAGIVLGQFTNCDQPESAGSLRLEEVLHDYFSAVDRPILAGMPCGHGTDNVTLPLGVEAQLDCDKRSLSLLEWPVRQRD